ncbi:MAG: zinc ribbon domain-containing protein [Acidobacteria bacterium]|nr:zinc ribbon domain-containing protein [Acidobacteriota bacterium]
MPIYEYLCRTCNARFEKLILGRHIDSPIACPRCGKAETEQLLSTFAVSTTNSSCPGTPGPGCVSSSGRFS